MRENKIFGFDITLVLATLILIVVGVLFIYSSGVSSTGVVFSDEYIKQIIWAGSGFIVMTAISFFDYSKLRNISFYIYILFCLLLIFTLLFGQVVNGARSWLSVAGYGLQPSEFGKVATILFLGTFLDKTKNNRTLLNYIICLIIFAVPFGLILLQPDMGTALVYIPVFFVMAFIAGVKKRYLFFIGLSGFFMILFSILPTLQYFIFKGEIKYIQIFTDREYLNYILPAILIIGILSFFGFYSFRKGYFYWIIYSITIFLVSLSGSTIVRMFLKEYQIKRLIVFINPEIDPRGAGWNVIQSITAVGSGGFSGKGFLKGTQSHYRYLPQQSTDFIFSIIAEEWGFIGGMLVFTLLFIILIRGLIIISLTKVSYAVYIGAGIIGMIFFHILINIGMAMGIMPITGIPLCFLSYGGSSLWTMLIAIGLLNSIYTKRYK